MYLKKATCLNNSALQEGTTVLQTVRGVDPFICPCPRSTGAANDRMEILGRGRGNGTARGCGSGQRGSESDFLKHGGQRKEVSVQRYEKPKPRGTGSERKAAAVGAYCWEGVKGRAALGAPRGQHADPSPRALTALVGCVARDTFMPAK